MRRCPAGFSSADWSVIKHDDGRAFFAKQIRRRQSGNPRSHDAHVGIGIRNKRMKRGSSMGHPCRDGTGSFHGTGGGIRILFNDRMRSFLRSEGECISTDAFALQFEQNIMFAVVSFEQWEQVVPIDRDVLGLFAVDPNLSRRR